MSFAVFYAAHSKLIDQLGINILLALSLSLSLRAGQLALAQAAFMGIGAYVSAIGAVTLGWPLPIAVVAAAGATAGAGFLLALPIGRLRGVFLAIATIGFGEIARIVEINLSITGGAEGFSNIPNDAHTLTIYTLLLVIAACLALFHRSKTALAISALREDEPAARGCGIDVGKLRILTLCAGATLAGIAGALYAHGNYFITPNDFGFSRMEEILTGCVIGGVTSSLGAALGAIVMTLLPESLRAVHDYRDIVSGAILLASIIFAPRGIAGLWIRTL